MLKASVFLGKRYEILERIGSGGMADVYKGKDHKLSRYVAIKVLKSDFRADEVFVSKFVSEARAAAGLMHPNVVNVYDVGQDRGLYFMVMELVEGITLKDYIEKKGKLSAKETISIAIQMVTGMQAAHNQHIIHRDIKPQNIIISKDGKVKVTDFGIARATTASNTISSNVMGSVHYTSPEQARGGATDEKSDIYSAGITMYEMVTGHVPFDGDSTVSVAIKHLQEEVLPPSEEVVIPYSLECIILKCIQKNPEYRYHSAQELITDLKRSLVDPEGDFVHLSAISHGTETVMLSEEDLNRIRRGAYDEDEYDEDEYDEDEYDEDEYDEDEYDEDEEIPDRAVKEEVNPGIARIMKILLIVVAIIIAFVGVYFIGRAAGIFGSGSNNIVSDSSNRVKVPDVVGMTEEEAREALNQRELGYKIVAREASDKYDKGTVMKQGTTANKRVEKNTQIELTISTGKEEVEVTVPDVTGKSESEAQSQLEDLGLVVESKASYSSSVDKGKVISTDPKAGKVLKEGDTVTMTISLGAEKVSVPNLIGKSEADAQSALSAAGLTGSVSTSHSDSVEEGLVISQGTNAGTKVTAGTSVSFVVSLGKEKVSVPYLISLSREDAEKALRDAGLAVGSVTEEYDGSMNAGLVISQVTSAGTEVEKGTAVSFVISLGKDVETVTVPNLIGRSESDAQAALSNVGLVGDPSSAYSDSIAVGYVSSQATAAGTQVEVGSVVHYSVSVGAEVTE